MASIQVMVLGGGVRPALRSFSGDSVDGMFVACDKLELDSRARTRSAIKQR